jgi:Ca2+-binding RTX toxin-like protein
VHNPPVGRGVRPAPKGDRAFGSGDDLITAGTGSDKVNGGAGFDVCRPGGGSNSVTNCEG